MEEAWIDETDEEAMGRAVVLETHYRLSLDAPAAWRGLEGVRGYPAERQPRLHRKSTGNAWRPTFKKGVQGGEPDKVRASN